MFWFFLSFQLFLSDLFSWLYYFSLWFCFLFWVFISFVYNWFNFWFLLFVCLFSCFCFLVLCLFPLCVCTFFFYLIFVWFYFYHLPAIFSLISLLLWWVTFRVLVPWPETRPDCLGIQHWILDTGQQDDSWPRGIFISDSSHKHHHLNPRPGFIQLPETNSDG